VIIAGSVTNEEARKLYPEGWEEPKPYLRIVPQPVRDGVRGKTAKRALNGPTDGVSSGTVPFTF